jgi:hypothetical protein
MAKTSVKKVPDSGFKLPQYLKLAKGAMWLDDISGIKLYAINTVFVGRGKTETGADVPKDKFDNKNFVDYGYIEKDIEESTWYVDTGTVPTEKQSRMILAFKHGILVEADPKNPPKIPKEKKEQTKDFTRDKKGDIVFTGKNKDIYKKLQNLKISELREFITMSPKSTTAKNNLMDMFHYEQLGYNKLARSRLEIMDLIKAKLKEYGPSISAIRIGEDDDLPVKK